MKKIILISSEFLGEGDSELGTKLMGSFLRKLSIEEKKPEKIIFLNSGVKLLAKGSFVLDGIELLSNSGVEMVACGTCVSHYKLTENISSEILSDMSTIISIMMNSDDVIRL